MKIDYDEAKRLSNIAKHGIDFKDCLKVFDDPQSFEMRSDRDGEQRCILIGRLGPTLIAVVFTLRGESLRIISARRARQNEREKWQASIL